MSGILADKYKNNNFKDILQSEYTVINNSENKLELELKPKASLSCSEVFLFKDFLEKEENREITLKLKYKENQTPKIISEWNDLVKYLTRSKPIMQAMLDNSKIEAVDEKLVVSLPIKGANFICNNNYDLEIKKIISEIYSCNHSLIINNNVS